jgi:hypothetical protein
VLQHVSDSGVETGQLLCCGICEVERAGAVLDVLLCYASVDMRGSVACRGLVRHLCRGEGQLITTPCMLQPALVLQQR